VVELVEDQWKFENKVEGTHLERLTRLVGLLSRTVASSGVLDRSKYV
jgi:hypothetical protein